LQLPSSRYVHDVSQTAIPDITADTVACALLHGWISRFDCPQTIATDQGRQFESQHFQAVTDDPGSNTDQKSVTDDPGSNTDQKYARRRDRQIYKWEE